MSLRSLSLVFLLLLGVAPAALARPLNLFYVGNSFTIDHDIPGKVAQSASAAGQAWPVYFTNLSRGKDFDYHLRRLKRNTKWKLSAAEYDAVILQGLSTEPTAAGDPGDFRRDAVSLARLFRAYSPSTRILVEQTWAYHPDNPAVYPRPIADAYAMNRQLLETSWAAAGDIDAYFGQRVASVVAPGDIFRNQDFPRSFYHSDLTHLSTEGGVLAALTLYAKIYGDDVSDIPYRKVRSWAQPLGVGATNWSDFTGYVDRYYFPQTRFARAMVLGSMSMPEPGTGLALLACGLTLRRRRSGS